MTSISKSVLTQAIFSKATTMKDGSLRLVFDTQELDHDSKAILFSLFNQFGNLIFSLPEVEPKIPVSSLKKGIPDPPGQTPSRRLRSVIYRYWEAMGKPGDSENFYNGEIERLIEAYKEKLD